MFDTIKKASISQKWNQKTSNVRGDPTTAANFFLLRSSSSPCLQRNCCVLWGQGDTLLSCGDTKISKDTKLRREATAAVSPCLFLSFSAGVRSSSERDKETSSPQEAVLWRQGELLLLLSLSPKDGQLSFGGSCPSANSCVLGRTRSKAIKVSTKALHLFYYWFETWLMVLSYCNLFSNPAPFLLCIEVKKDADLPFLWR